MIPWAPKGQGRNGLGLLAHAIGGSLLGLLFYGVDTWSYGPEQAIASILAAVLAGILWEIIGWKLFRWPANLLDVLPWPLGALTVSISLLAALGY